MLIYFAVFPYFYSWHQLYIRMLHLYLLDISVVDVGSGEFNCVSFYLAVILINLEQRTRQESEDTIVNVVITD